MEIMKILTVGLFILSALLILGVIILLMMLERSFFKKEEPGISDIIWYVLQILLADLRESVKNFSVKLRT